MSDVLGYVVVEWNQAGQPDSAGVELYTGYYGREEAGDAAKMLADYAQSEGRSTRYSVHAVMAEEIEEAQ